MLRLLWYKLPSPLSFSLLHSWVTPDTSLSLPSSYRADFPLASLSRWATMGKTIFLIHCSKPVTAVVKPSHTHPLIYHSPAALCAHHGLQPKLLEYFTSSGKHPDLLRKVSLIR